MYLLACGEQCEACDDPNYCEYCIDDYYRYENGTCGGKHSISIMFNIHIYITHVIIVTNIKQIYKIYKIM